MRTTLTLEDGIARELKRLARETNRSFKQVVNETLKRGLAAGRESPGRPYQIKPVSLGGVLPGINLDKALRLSDRLENEEIARKIELRK